MPILKIHKNALYVNNELVKFQFEIDTVLVLDSQVIVLIKTPYDIDNNDNVYSVDFHGKITHKSIQAYSVEYLLNNKGINLTFVTTAGDINNTSSTTVITSNYFFYRETQPEKSLLHQLIKVAPQWSIGYVSSSLKNKLEKELKAIDSFESYLLDKNRWLNIKE
jgi:hypothetical protein